MFDPDVDGDKRYDIARCVALLDRCTVSSHFLISRDGTAVACVPVEKCAFHAGLSVLPFPYDPRSDVSNFSIGVELVGDWTDPFYVYPYGQYLALAHLVTELSARHPIRYVLGHDHIAPDRKRDPGSHFNWKLLYRLINSYPV